MLICFRDDLIDSHVRYRLANNCPDAISNLCKCDIYLSDRSIEIIISFLFTILPHWNGLRLILCTIKCIRPAVVYRYHILHGHATAHKLAGHSLSTQLGWWLHSKGCQLMVDSPRKRSQIVIADFILLWNGLTGSSFTALDQMIWSHLNPEESE